jgi:hypothetical protein
MLDRSTLLLGETTMDERNGKLSSTNGAHEPGPVSEDALRRAWETVDAVRARNADKSPEEVLEEVTAEVEAVRQERYERSRAAAKRSR